MQNNWILDVLADLKTFALANGLLTLAKQLDDTALVAAADLLSVKEGMGVDATTAGSNIKGVGAGIRA